MRTPAGRPGCRSQSGEYTSEPFHPAGHTVDMRLAIGLGIALLPLTPLLSAANPDLAPAALPAGLALLVGLSASHPTAGLMIVSALVPISGWMGSVLELQPLRMAEALVLAVLSGVLLRLAVDSRREPAGATLPAGLGATAALGFVAVTAAAVCVEFGVAHAGLPRRQFALDFLRSLSGDYLFGSPAVLPGLVDAALLVEGVTLLLAILVLSRRRVDLPRRLAGALLAGAVGAALINIAGLAADVAASDPPLARLAAYFRGGARLGGHIGDLNATASYFLMMLLTGVGLAAGRVDRRPPLACTHVPGAVAIGTAFWCAGSRTAVLAALIVGLAALSLWLRSRVSTPRSRTVVLAGAVIVTICLLPVAALWSFPDRDRITRVPDAVRLRTDFVATSLRMWATEPVFGIGPGRYYDLSEQFMSPRLKTLFVRENAHNNFLQIATELGAAGLACFLGLLAAVAASAVRALGMRPRPGPLLIGAGAGVAAFLLTCLASHPLLTPETAYPFWIACGLVAALAARGLPAAPVPARRHALLGVTVALLLAATLPGRVDAAVGALVSGERHAGPGMYDWETDSATGRRFRWTGPRATFLVAGHAGAVRLPLRAGHADRDRPVVVELTVGGHRMARVPLLDDRWIDFPLQLPGTRGTPGLQRIELTVEPPWTPDERRNGDGRVLGVQVQEMRPFPGAGSGGE